MERNFRFLHMTDVEKSELSPHDIGRDISNLSTSVMWRNLDCLHMMSGEKFQISPHDRCIEIWNFSTWQIFLHGYDPCTRDTYEVCIIYISSSLLSKCHQQSTVGCKLPCSIFIMIIATKMCISSKCYQFCNKITWFPLKMTDLYVFIEHECCL